jgi:hypothetical protein
LIIVIAVPPLLVIVAYASAVPHLNLRPPAGKCPEKEGALKHEDSAALGREQRDIAKCKRRDRSQARNEGAIGLTH